MNVMKWPFKVMWNKFGKYEQVRSFKTLGSACDWMDDHPEINAVLYVRDDLVRFR